jgi:hypothetical protein
MRTHELKILPEYFNELWVGTKRFELRKDDKEYQILDEVKLMEWNGKEYTGASIGFTINYVLRDVPHFGLKEGYVILGLQ